MRTSILSSALLLVGGAVAGCQGKPSTCQTLDASIVAHTGQPVGQEVKNGNSEFEFISQPRKSLRR